MVKKDTFTAFIEFPSIDNFCKSSLVSCVSKVVNVDIKQKLGYGTLDVCVNNFLVHN